MENRVERHYQESGEGIERIILDNDGSVFVREKTCNLDNHTSDTAWCSECGEWMPYPFERTFNYCQNCGSKVEKR